MERVSWLTAVQVLNSWESVSLDTLAFLSAFILLANGKNVCVKAKCSSRLVLVVFRAMTSCLFHNFAACHLFQTEIFVQN